MSSRGMSPSLAIARRDLLEFVRDRRTVFITFLLPLIAYPVVALATVLGLRTTLERVDRRAVAVPLSIVLSGSDAAVLASRITQLRDDETLRSSLNRADGWPASLDVLVAADAQDAVLNLDEGRADAWIEVPSGTATSLAGLGTIELLVRGTAMVENETKKLDHLDAIFASLTDAIRRERLERLDVPRAALEPLEVTYAREAVSPGAVDASTVLPTVVGSLLVILTLLTVTGAFHPAADAFAGEKERGTIETLLVAPCGILQVVWGKYLAVFGVTLATLAANLVAIAFTAAVGMRALPAAFLQVFSETPPLAGVVAAMVAQIALSAVAAATCLAITSALQSLKEAHHALTTVMLAVSLLAATGLLPSPVPPLVLSAVPVTGQVLVSRQALAGDPVGMMLVVTVVSSVVCSWLLLKAASTALADEQVIFRGPDATGSLFQRPAPRILPTAMQGLLPAILALAAMWYVQGLLPQGLVVGLPLQQLFSMLLPLAAVATWQRVDLRRTLRLELPTKRGWLAVFGGAFIGGGLFLLGAIALQWFVGDTPSPSAKSLADRLMDLLSQTPWWLTVLVLAVLPAVCEELVFRGWMLSALVGGQATMGRRTAAVIAQAAFFAAIHLLPERLPTTFVMGLVLGWIALRTESLLPGIVCHVVHNAMPVAIYRFVGTPLESLEVRPAWLAVIGVTVVLVGASLVAAGSRRVTRFGSPA